MSRYSLHTSILWLVSLVIVIFTKVDKTTVRISLAAPQSSDWPLRDSALPFDQKSISRIPIASKITPAAASSNRPN
jgi:hypothetical protein